jgi:hypothetical protein
MKLVKVGKKKLKIINEDSKKWSIEWELLKRKSSFISSNFDKFYSYKVTGGFGIYRVKKQCNGLTKYTIESKVQPDMENTRKEILNQITKKEQIIIMETKTSYTVMECPDSYLYCV